MPKKYLVFISSARDDLKTERRELIRIVSEMGMLIRENKTLRKKIKKEDSCFCEKIKEEAKQTLRLLAANRISLSFYYTDGENWENSRSFRYLRLFRLLAPELSAPKTAAVISRFLGNILNPDLRKVVRKDFPAPSNTIKKIMTDFTVLGLAEGNGEAWEIKGIIPQGKPCAKNSLTRGRPLWRLSAASRGVSNPVFPHSLDHVRASASAISLISSMTEYGNETFAVLRLRQMKRAGEAKMKKREGFRPAGFQAE